MSHNQEVMLQMLDEIDRARSGVISLDDLEQNLWRLLDAADESFSPVVAGQVEDLALELRRLQAENLASGSVRDVDENRGAETIFNYVAGELHRALR